MSALTVIGQLAPADTSTTAAVVFGVIVVIGVLSIIGLTRRGRRTIMPLVAILLGASIIATTISDATSATISPITFLGLFFGGILAIGGLGALREGVEVPKVEGVEPDIHPRGPHSPPDDA